MKNAVFLKKITMIIQACSSNLTFKVSFDYLFLISNDYLTFVTLAWSTKPVLSRWSIFVAIANNTLYGSKLYIFLLCQKSLAYYVKIMFH